VNVHQVVEALSLETVAGGIALDAEVSGGYASDLLSCVMASAKAGNVWVTLQAHPNVIAVAELLDLACVIITEGEKPDEETLRRADENNVPTLLTPQDTFAIVSQLAELGIKGN